MNAEIVAWCAKQEFGQIVMTAKKLAAMVPVSNELLSFSPMNAESEIQADLIEEMGKTEDENLLRADGNEGAPIGLRFATNASNITASNGTSAANIEDDFTDLIEDLEGNNVRMVRPHLVMSSRSKNHLLNLRDAKRQPDIPGTS